MPLLLVDALEPAEAAALRAHLASGCPRCSASLAEADAALSYLPYALEPQAAPAGARGRLLATIEAGETIGYAERVGGPSTARRTWWSRTPTWARVGVPALVAACIAVVVTGQIMLNAMRKQRLDYLAELRGRDQRINVLSGQVDSSAHAIKVFYESSQQISLQGRAQQRAKARALWDERRQSWHFRAYGLEPLGPKEAYELWFVTPYGRKVPAGTFLPDDHGSAQMTVQLPKDVGPVAGAFVTDEPSVGTFQPTGAIQLSGKLE